MEMRERKAGAGKQVGSAGEVTCRPMVRCFFSEHKSSRKNYLLETTGKDPFLSIFLAVTAGCCGELQHGQVLLKPCKGQRVCVFR